jgi:hypothetical protein
VTQQRLCLGSRNASQTLLNAPGWQHTVDSYEREKLSPSLGPSSSRVPGVVSTRCPAPSCRERG